MTKTKNQGNPIQSIMMYIFHAIPCYIAIYFSIINRPGVAGAVLLDLWTYNMFLSLLLNSLLLENLICTFCAEFS